MPRVRVDQALALYRAMDGLAGSGVLRTATTPAKAGLGWSLAMMVMGSRLGLEIDLERVPAGAALDPTVLLFSESNSRFVVTCAPEDTAALEAAFEGLPAARVGTVTDEGSLRVSHGGTEIATLDADVIASAFQQTLRGV